jgi:hypothetical protein
VPVHLGKKGNRQNLDDGGNLSYNYSDYAREGHPALKYHKTHIINFQELYDITGDVELLRIK